MNEKNKDIIQIYIKNLQISFENHRQDYLVVCSEIEPLILQLEHIGEVDFSKDFSELIQGIKKIDFTRTSKNNLFRNEIGRYFESIIAVDLLQNPTQKMLEAAKAVSDHLAVLIIDYSDEDSPLSEVFSHFFRSLRDNPSAFINLGAFKKLDSADQIIESLLQNIKQDFIQTMFVHYKSGQNYFRSVPIPAPTNQVPVGEFANIINTIYESYDDFCITIDNLKSKKDRGLIDALIYSSELYTVERDRGRKEFKENASTNQLGLLLFDQNARREFPQVPMTWVPDCLAQAPDFNSVYVRDLIENDCVYIAGPSGMASVFLGQMETVCNLPTVELKQHYLNCIMAYIVGGGFHSIHEVIGPAEYALKLVPGYNISEPNIEIKADAPNYHCYFEQFMTIDPEFSERYNNAWIKLTNKFRDNVLNKCNKVITPEKDSYNGSFLRRNRVRRINDSEDHSMDLNSTSSMRFGK